VYALVLLAALNAGQFPAPPQFPASHRSPDCFCDDCQCSPCHCEPLPAGDWRWVETSKPDQVALYKGATQVGNHWRSSRTFRRLVSFQGTDAWLVQARPAGSPEPPAAPVAVIPTPAPVPYIQAVPTWHAMPYYRTAPAYRGGAACST
jgi:hypothetical protein